MGQGKLSARQNDSAAKWLPLQEVAAATPRGRTRLGKVWKIKIPQLAAAASTALPVLCCVFPLIWSHVNDKSQQRQLARQFSSSSSSGRGGSSVAFKPTDFSPFGSGGACLPWRTAAFLVSLLTTTSNISLHIIKNKKRNGGNWWMQRGLGSND